MATLAACQQMPANQHAAANSAAPAGATPAQASRSGVSTVVEFRLAQTQPAKNLSILHLGKDTLYYFQPPVLTGNDLAKAVPMKNQRGQAFVRFVFNRQGAQRLAQLSQSNAGRLLLVTVNGKLVAAPRIGGPMTEGVMNMTTDTDRNAVLIAGEVNGSVSRK